MNAAWRRNVYTPRKYLDLCVTGSDVLEMAPLAVPGFSWNYLRPGLMHVGCLGVCQECLGNTLYEAFKELGGVYKNPREAVGAIDRGTVTSQT